MSVARVIRKAERVLPGKQARDGELDPRWQAIIAIAKHIERYPNQVWRFARNWGAHANADIRMAIATCLLEHLLEHHFERMYPLVSEACGQSRRFADTFSKCWQFGQARRPRNSRRFRSLQGRAAAKARRAKK